MGRRKIEIQPIQHDRNRSVTFLKRKNGLFKKAYELGVLCSADVAVIVFGHNHKLYEYCSTDINALLTRQREYSGDRDTKGPSDFSTDKGDGADDDSDSGGEVTAAKGKMSQSRPKGKGSTGGESQLLAPEGRFAVPPPLPNPEPPSSRPIKREEPPPIITSINAPPPPMANSVRNTAMPSSAGPARWHSDNGFSAHGSSNGPTSIPHSYDPRSEEWPRPHITDRRPSWSNAMPSSGVPGSNSPLNTLYQPPHLTQPPISRPVNLLTPAHSHPAPLNEILAAHPQLAQQLGSSASPNPGFGNSSTLHDLYNNPIFQPLASQGPSTSSDQSLDMDWTMSRSLQSQSQPHNAITREFPSHQPDNLPPDLSWLEALGQGDRGGSEPWSFGDSRDRVGIPKATTPMVYTPSFAETALKRPLSSTTPISPPETGGTPHQEQDNDIGAENTFGILEADLGVAKRARIQ